MSKRQIQMPGGYSVTASWRVKRHQAARRKVPSARYHYQHQRQLASSYQFLDLVLITSYHITMSWLVGVAPLLQCLPHVSNLTKPQGRSTRNEQRTKSFNTSGEADRHLHDR